MPFDGNGTYNPISPPLFPAVAGTTITATQYNSEILDIASALSTCLLKDGQSSPVADISWALHKLTNLADPTSLKDAANKQYVDTGDAAVTSSVTAAANSYSIARASNNTQVQNLQGSASATSASFSWTAGRTINASGALTNRGSGSVSINLATSGLNGRDAAGNYLNQWVYAYAIWNGTTWAGITSPNFGSPSLALASGYTDWMYLGPIRIGGTNNTALSCYIRKDKLYWASGVSPVAGGTAIAASTTYAMSNLSVYLPPQCVSFRIDATITATRTAGGSYAINCTWRDNSNGAQFAGQTYSNDGPASTQAGTTVSTELPAVSGNVSFVVGAGVAWSASNLYANIAWTRFSGNGAY